MTRPVTPRRLGASAHGGMVALPEVDLAARVSPANGIASLDEHTVEISSLSSVGVSFRLDETAHRGLASHDALVLSLALPGHARRSAVACQVRSRTSADDGHVLYSCEYDWSATMDPLGVVEDLVGFMLEMGD